MLRRTLLFVSLILGAAGRGHAQDITLAKLISLHGLPGTLTPECPEAAQLTEWVFRPEKGTPQAEPLTWAWWPPADPAGLQPLGQLSLRPNGGTFDVLLHLRRAGPFNRLRRELERQHLLPEAVTCVGCTTGPGERYATPSCSVVFYQGKPEPYPYLIVVQPKLPLPTPAPRPR